MTDLRNTSFTFITVMIIQQLKKVSYFLSSSDKDVKNSLVGKRLKSYYYTFINGIKSVFRKEVMMNTLRKSEILLCWVHSGEDLSRIPWELCSKDDKKAIPVNEYGFLEPFKMNEEEVKDLEERRSFCRRSSKKWNRVFELSCKKDKREKKREKFLRSIHKVSRLSDLY